MRNKLKTISSILAISLLLPVVVLAQEANMDTRGREMAPMDHQKTDRVSGLKRVALTQARRTEKALNHLSEMITKIEGAIKVLKDRGADVSSLQTSLDKAKTLKSEAESMLAELKSKHTAIDPEGTEPKRQVQAFQTEMNGIKKKLIELHRALKDIVKQMRSLDKPARSTTNPEENQ